MTRKILSAIAALVLTTGGALAQVGVMSVPNDTATGTTVGKLAKLVTSGANSTAIITATSDVAGIAGVVVGSSGTSGITGNALIAMTGRAPCTVDAGGVTAGRPLVNSTATPGLCMDGLAHPTMEIVGYALATVASGPVDMQIVPRRLAPSVVLPPVTFTATGNMDMSLTGTGTTSASSTASVCNAQLQYNSASAGTLSILATAFAGCSAVLTQLGAGKPTIAVTGGSFASNGACATTPSPAGQGAVIGIQVQSNPGTAPVVTISGTCG
jgi:hypothetical protein